MGLILLFLIMGCNKNPVYEGISPGPIIYPVIDDFPAWSPEGSTIAYHHFHYTYIDSATGRGGYDYDSTGIWFISPDGSNNRMFLKDGDLPDWSPDGKWIAFVRGAQIYKIMVNGDSLTQLTFEGRNFFPDWSPDGSKIAWDTNANDPKGANVIWIMNTDGSNKKDISQHGVGEWREPDWSPDGQRIAHVRYPGGVFSSEIFLMDSTGDNPLRLTYNSVPDYYPAISPDGNKIVFSSNNELWIMNTDGSNSIQLTIEGGTEPAWSPDGTKIVYHRYRYREYSSTNGTLWLMNADGTNQQPLTFGPMGGAK